MSSVTRLTEALRGRQIPLVVSANTTVNWREFPPGLSVPQMVTLLQREYQTLPLEPGMAPALDNIRTILLAQRPSASGCLCYRIVDMHLQSASLATTAGTE